MTVMPWPGLARRFPALGYRDFWLLLADRLLAPGAFAFSLVGVSFAVLDATESTADLSYVLAAQILPSLVFAMVGGVRSGEHTSELESHSDLVCRLLLAKKKRPCTRECRGAAGRRRH